MTANGHKHSASLTVNQKAQLANAYNELGKELSSHKVRVVGNYTLGKVIGEGSFGTVRMGTHRLTSTRVAIKQIPKAMSAQLTREIHHHRRLHHPHVVQLYEIIATENYIWLVTELCSGGELYDYLVEKGRLSEEETRIIFGQLCLAIGFIHEKGVVHRDLKLENVLLDERCRVKLSDFGFTREYERGSFLETWCGTTGYAAPEILLCQKYLGQEVDIWSLGVILYTLLTGTLPFDDDDEVIQREKIIRSEYEDPEWLSPEARDLIRKILQKEPMRRLGIPQILKHPFITNQRLGPSAASTRSAPLAEAEEPDEEERDAVIHANHTGMSSEHSDSTGTTYHSAFSDLSQSAPTTPEGSTVGEGLVLHHSNHSGSTITKPLVQEDLFTPVRKVMQKDSTITNEVLSPVDLGNFIKSSASTPSFASKAPPTLTTRTPARTKRRSNGSTLSIPSPTTPTFPNPPPVQDFLSALHAPAPIVFSTPLERDLLNSLSALGFDTGQMVHSVLTDACDCSGSFWWMMRKKAERRSLEEPLQPNDARKDGLLAVPNHRASHSLSESSESVVDGLNANQASTPAESSPVAKPATPNLGVLPPTPTLPGQPRTPSPPVISPVLLSAYGTPSKERSGNGTPTNSKNRGTKPRSASVSIMQRATTALEAAGLVRKKSDEKFRIKEEQEKERERKEKEERDRRAASAEEARALSNKLTKSPPVKPMKDGLPSTPVTELPGLSGLPATSSPWVTPTNSASSPSQAPPTPANTPGDSAAPLPAADSVGSSTTKHRARASILHTFRMWFNEDRKGKRKAAANALAHQHAIPPVSPPVSAGSVRGGRKRRSGSGSVQGTRRGGHQKRPSASSRRSSSVNSRRSSIASIHKIPGVEFLQQHANEDLYNPRRRSFGTRTPTSERGEHPSRPSSIRSFQVSTPGVNTMRRSHSPSEGSAGSGRRSLRRTESPLQRYHRRAGSGSSTRVIRQIKTVHPPHVRSNSLSSNHSAPSSRPTSFYEGSEAEERSSPRAFSPSNEETPRRAPYSTTVLVAHKKHTPFRQPSLGRSSWKKAWGVEPPGWKSRSTEAPFEILFTDDPRTNVRDVFSGRPSLNLDDDEWVDEEDDLPFAGGLGQVTLSSSTTQTVPLSKVNDTFYKAEPLILSPPPGRDGRGQGKRNANRSTGRQKAVHSPVTGTAILPPTVEHPQADSRTARRQRAEPAFGQPIQEEDEDEE